MNTNGDTNTNADTSQFHDSIHIVSLPRPCKTKRRVRPNTLADAPGFESLAGLHAAEPPSSFVRHLKDANQHFHTADHHDAYLALHYTRSFWGMGRYDEAFAAATNLAMEVQWDQVEAEYEEIDPASRAVLAADHLAKMPGHQVFNSHFSLNLRRAALLHRVLNTPRKAA